MAEISIVCKRTVVSTIPVEANKFCSLSCLDHMMEHNNLRMVYYYHFPSEVELGKATMKLRESLSEMLTSFPIVTGRLQKTPEGLWRIKCNDAGVRMIEARARGSVEEWLQSADRELELSLVYWEDMFHKPYFWSTLYIQLTEFEGGGIAIGLSCSHLLADATCATMLIKAWAETHAFGKMLTPPHFHPLPSRNAENKDIIDHNPCFDHLISNYKSSIDKTPTLSPNERFITVTFTFTNEMVSKCMAETEAGGNAITESSSTPFTALTALFWVSISKVRGKKKQELIGMSICLDARKVLKLDKGFFGNCMVFNKVCGKGLKEEEIILESATKAIQASLKNMENYERIMDLIECLESKKLCSAHWPYGSDVDLVCANWESLGSYSAMFESGVKPIRVSCYLQPVLGQVQVLILPSPDGEGSLSSVAMVTLAEEEAIRLCEEPLILRFSPTILMGVKKNQSYKTGQM